MSTIKVNRIENTASSSGGINIDASGRVGVDSTPEAWSGFSALEVNEASIVSSGSGDAFFTANAYYDGAWKYKDAGVARNIYMNADGIVFRVAASGSADAAITWSEAMRINTDSSIRLGSGCPGIDFSQIQTNNAGMTSETLDSYEEGNFTPTYSSGLTSPSYTGTSGNYTKIGNLVTLTIRIRATGTNASSHLQIAGLPFTSGGSMQEGSFSFGYSDNISNSSSGIPVIHVPTNGTSMQFYNQDGSNWNGNSGGGINGRTLHIRGFYFV